MPTSPSDRLRQHLQSSVMPGLNGTRAIAALAVVFGHWSPLFTSHNRFSEISPGPYAVIFFFVLSGFLITTLLLREEGRAGRVDLKAFWMRRSLRILPALYVFLIIQAILIRKFPWDFAASALYVYNYYQPFFLAWRASLVGHTWSLSVEEQFYILWPLAFVFTKDRQKLKKYLVIGILAVQILRAFGNHFGVPLYYSYFAFEFRCDALMIGCLMAIKLREAPRAPAWMLNRALGFCALAVPLVLMYPFKSHFIAAKIIGPFGYTIGAYVGAVLILQTITYAPVALTNQVMNYLGATSYSIYLYHLMFLYLAEQLVGRWSTPAVVAFYVLGTVAAASTSYQLVEKPFLRLKSHFEGRRKRDAQLAPDRGPAMPEVGVLEG